MRIKINNIIKVLKEAHNEGYEPIITINGEYYDVDYTEKPKTEADIIKEEGRF